MAPEDDALEKLLEDRITEVYNQAAAEVTRKWEKYMEDFARKDKAKQQLVKSGRLSKDDYLKWRKGQVLVGNRWAEMRDVLSKDMLNADKIAVSVINDFMPEAYAIGHNYGTFEIESGSLINTSYTLYSRETVERLIKDQPRLLNVTKWELNAPKDKRWNQQHITQQITQGILQGEDIRQVSKRLQNVVGMDKGAAMRNARTAMTGAQNGGRLDAYQRAVDMGIKTEKEWLATLDASTRDSHIDMDGEHVPVDETFSNGLQFPGEMGGPPAEVYNCRCTLIPRLADVDYSKDNDLRWRRDEDLGDMSYDEWKETHAGKDSKKMKEFDHRIVNGKDLFGAWERRPDKFAFEIEDIINAQGFDGLPQVVDQRQFDAAAEESNFIAQRTYSAPDQATLDAYREQLYNGKWYVDCSTGGAAYGKGMYSACNFGTKINDYIEQEMYRYGAGRPFAYVETFTVSKDFRFVTTSEMAEIRERLQKEIRTGVKQRGGWLNDAAAQWAEKQGEILGYDDGTLAAILGYDGLLTSGMDKYAIILNRTKVVFLRG